MMATALKLIGNPLAWAIAAFVGVLGFAGVQTLRLKDAQAATASWENASNEWKAAATGWQSAFNLSEARRAAEQSTAAAAVDALDIQCAARVAEARRSTAAIQTLVTKAPTYDPNNCPVRALLDPGGLLDAVSAGTH